mgnify:CR=1 FL=1|jgi:hypothetical protein
MLAFFGTCAEDRLQRHMQPTGGHVRTDELDDGGGHGGSEPARRTVCAQVKTESQAT